MWNDSCVTSMVSANLEPANPESLESPHKQHGRWGHGPMEENYSRHCYPYLMSVPPWESIALESPLSPSFWCFNPHRLEPARSVEVGSLTCCRFRFRLRLGSGALMLLPRCV
jgi:hypothetical protein